MAQTETNANNPKGENSRQQTTEFRGLTDARFTLRIMSTTDRPKISADLRRRVLVEAGHRCAIPTCRYIHVEIHHIIPWESCKQHEYFNLIALCANCHGRADIGEIDRKALRIYKSSLRFTHDKFSQFEVDVLFLSVGMAAGNSMHFPPTMTLLIKRLLDADFVELQQNPNGSSSSFGMQISPLFLNITEKGRAYVESLGLDEVWSDDA